MMRNPIFRTLVPAVALVLGTACSDTFGPQHEAPEPVLGGARILAHVECIANVELHQLTCHPAGPGSGGPSRAILGTNQIKLASSNVVSDTIAGTFSFDVTLQNLLAEPIGTPDGQLRIGSRVFHDAGPTVTAYKVAGDTGTITVANADGVGNFTRPGQPYHFYDTILAPQAVSKVKRWVLRMPRTVKTFGLSMKVFAPIPSEPKVPEVAPDSVPESVYAAEKISTNLPVMSGTYVRDIVTVLFKPGTPQEERQAAINSVSGTVVGGVRMGDGDGEYYVRIADDGTGQPLLNAIDRLAALPQVIGTGPEFIEREAFSYLRPSDGAEYQGWKLRPFEADSANWGLEAIQAPFAWGCTTGSTATRIAVVDRGFHTADVQDVALNTRSVHSDNGVWPDSVDHGVEVSSVIAARGNNGLGTTGVMWKAGLDLYGLGTNWLGQPTVNAKGEYVIRDVISGLSKAIASGAPIVNVSMGMSWDHAPSTAADRRRVDAYYRRMKGMVAWHELLGRKPLIVVAAGNMYYPHTTGGQDAYWAGFPRLVEDFEERVIVVSAVAQEGSGLRLATFSHSGPLVQLAAPGQAIGVLNGANTLGLINGTSFAAPMVAGAAGLLLSFDPRLSAPELKELLIMGAVAGGQRVANLMAGGTTPVLSAYEPLRIAAERQGAPLCGNRLWLTETGSVHASRGVGASEQIFAVAPGSDYLSGLHGGDVRVYDRGPMQTVVFRWSTAGWNRVPTTDPAYSDRGPVIRSGALSHQGDSLLVMTEGPNIQMLMKDRATGVSRLIGVVPVATGGSGNSSVICTQMRTTAETPQGTCVDSVGVGSSTSTTRGPGAYSPRGDTAVVGIYTDQGSSYLSRDWEVCPDQNPEAMITEVYYCREYTSTSSTTGSRIYQLSSAGVKLLTTLTGRIDDLTMADGLVSDIYARAVHSEQRIVHKYFSHFATPFDVYASRWSRGADPERTTSANSCTAFFHDMVSGQQTQLPACTLWHGGSMAPNRVPAP